MQKSKLIQLLQGFSKEELRELGKFATLPFFNARPEAAQLLQLLLKPLLAGKKIPEKETVFQHLFPGAAYDDHRVRMAMTALLHCAEKYLVVRDLLGDTPEYKRRLSRLLKARNLPEQAAAAWQQGKEAFEQTPWKNADYYYELYRLEEENYRENLNNAGAEQADLQALSDGLDAAMLAKKLWQACFLLAHQARYNAPCDYGFLEQMLPFVDRYRHLPVVAMYWHCYMALTQSTDEPHFQLFKEALLGQGEYFPPEELRDLYILAINFCTRRYNEGDHRYIRDQFELYRTGFEQHYFLSNGVLSRFTYLNAATIGLVLREFVWVENFIKSQYTLLEPAHREGLYAFNLARLSYQKGQYGEALQLLQRAEYKETMLALAAKTMQLKIYYEMQAFDLLDSHIGAIKAFIRRKKVMGYHRENYLNLLHFVQKMLEINPFDKKSIATFRDAVAAAKPLAEKEWLLAQVQS